MTLTAAQLIERRAFLGASECAAALGMSPFFTSFQLYQSKLGEAEPIETTLPMMVGNALEPVALSLFAKETGLQVAQQQHVYLDSKRSWRRATIDGMASDGNPIEAKSSGDFRSWGDADDDVPEHYLYNAQHTMACVPGADKVYFPVILGARSFHIYEVQRDNELIELLTNAEEEFWEMVRKKTPPDPTTTEDIKRYYPRSYGTTILGTEDDENLVQLLRKVKAEKKIAEVQEESLSNTLRQRIGVNDAILGGAGKPMATWKSQSDNRLDVTRIRAERPDIVAEYELHGTKRVLLLKK